MQLLAKISQVRTNSRDKRLYKKYTKAQVGDNENPFRQDGDKIPNALSFKGFYDKYNVTEEAAILKQQSDKPKKLLERISRLCGEPSNAFDVDVLRVKLNQDEGLAKKILNDSEVKECLLTGPDCFNYHKVTQNGETYFDATVATNPKNPNQYDKFMECMLNPRSSGLTQIADQIEQYCPSADFNFYKQFDYRIIPERTIKSQDNKHCFYQSSDMMIIKYDEILNNHFDKQVEDAVKKKYTSYTYTVMISSNPNEPAHEIANTLIFKNGKVSQILFANPQGGASSSRSLKDYYLPVLKQLANLPQQPPGAWVRFTFVFRKIASVLPFVDDPVLKNSHLSLPLQNMVKGLIDENGDLKNPIDKKAFEQYEKFCIDTSGKIPTLKTQKVDQGSCARAATTDALVQASYCKAIGNGISDKSTNDNITSLGVFANTVFPPEQAYKKTQLLLGAQSASFYVGHMNTYYKSQNKNKDPKEISDYIKKTVANASNVLGSKFDLTIDTASKGVKFNLNGKNCSQLEGQRLNYAIEVLQKMINDDLKNSNNENQHYKFSIVEKTVRHFKPNMFNNADIDANKQQNEASGIAPQSEMRQSDATKLTQEQLDLGNKKIPSVVGRNETGIAPEHKNGRPEQTNNQQSFAAGMSDHKRSDANAQIS